MAEIFETIDANARDRAERDRIAYEEQQAERKQVKLAKRKQATRALLIRVLFVVAVCIAMSSAGRTGLMDLTLIRGIYTSLAVWISFWTGAWFQFMWCKGGLLA